MTLRQLIAELSEIDDDLKDYEVYVIVREQITSDLRMSIIKPIDIVSENADIGSNRIFLKTKIK